MKIAMDYIPAVHTFKRRFLAVAATLFMIIGSFLFGLVIVQSIMDDVAPAATPISNVTICT